MCDGPSRNRNPGRARRLPAGLPSVISYGSVFGDIEPYLGDRAECSGADFRLENIRAKSGSSDFKREVLDRWSALTPSDGVGF